MVHKTTDEENYSGIIEDGFEAYTVAFDEIASFVKENREKKLDLTIRMEDFFKTKYEFSKVLENLYELGFSEKSIILRLPIGLTHFEDEKLSGKNLFSEFEDRLNVKLSFIYKIVLPTTFSQEIFFNRNGVALVVPSTLHYFIGRNFQTNEEIWSNGKNGYETYVVEQKYLELNEYAFVFDNIGTSYESDFESDEIGGNSQSYSETAGSSDDDVNENMSEDYGVEFDEISDDEAYTSDSISSPAACPPMSSMPPSATPMAHTPHFYATKVAHSDHIYQGKLNRGINKNNKATQGRKECYFATEQKRTKIKTAVFAPPLIKYGEFFTIHVLICHHKDFKEICVRYNRQSDKTKKVGDKEFKLVIPESAKIDIKASLKDLQINNIVSEDKVSKIWENSTIDEDLRLKVPAGYSFPKINGEVEILINKKSACKMTFDLAVLRDSGKCNEILKKFIDSPEWKIFAVMVL